MGIDIEISLWLGRNNSVTQNTGNENASTMANFLIEFHLKILSAFINHDERLSFRMKESLIQGWHTNLCHHDTVKMPGN